MYISPISQNNNPFKGTLKINNLKNGTTRCITTSAEAGAKMHETFSGTTMLNNRLYEFTGGGAAKALERLRGFVKFFADSAGSDFHKDLTYPEVKDFAANYKSTAKSAEINVPNHFSIKLEV